jgi:hypothetical protein
MKRVEAVNLIPGVQYRIHWNGHNNDVLGTFVEYDKENPVFEHVNYATIDEYPPRRITTYKVAFNPSHHTFYESAKTIQKENKQKTLKVVLDGLVPGLGDAKKDYFGGKRKSRRRKTKCK